MHAAAMSDPQPLPPTCSLPEAGQRCWDVIVVGAGPAGSLAARQLAAQGAAVLLVDKADFPRRKVCGCFLNGSALETLQAVGLGDLPQRLGAPRVTSVRLGTQGRTARIDLPPGAALSRETLDTELIREAIRAGAAFLPHTEARVGGLLEVGRALELYAAGEQHAASAKTVIVADGVGGRSLKDCHDVQYRLAPRSLVGVSAMSEALPEDYVRGTIHMAIGRGGYVGALQMEDGRLDVAAAFDPLYLKRTSPGELAQQTVDQSGLPRLRGLAELRWMGTPPLSRTASMPAARRLFLIGDAAGYVEPFTGEGMSWALASARLVVPIVLQNISQDSPHLMRQWSGEYRRHLQSRQRLCRALSRGLRRPWLAASSVTALRYVPWLATPVVRWLNRAPGANH